MSETITIEKIETSTIDGPKKRGRKSKKELALIMESKFTSSQEGISNSILSDIVTAPVLEFNVNDTMLTVDESQKPIAKKRGRKPKGGKIVSQILSTSNLNNSIPNVILHLKCSSKDLHHNISTNDTLDIESYTFGTKHDLSFDEINNTPTILQPQQSQKYEYIADSIEKEESVSNKSDVSSVKSKEIWNKLKILEQNLHINHESSDKKSACFWCTYDFDNPTIYIPKHYITKSYHVYGCFCSPECAVAHLMNENIDSSIKFERYHLINHFYSEIYNYEKNIKPAPNPYYMLDKYCGNLTIQEYRSLLRNERLFLIVDKPLTRIMPELHEDNDEFILNNKIIPSSNYHIKKKIQKKTQNKSNILNEQFGITNN